MLFFSSTLTPAIQREAILEKLLYPTEFIPYHFQFSFCYPILSSGYALRPDLITMFWEFSFSGLDGENPYHHLRELDIEYPLKILDQKERGTRRKAVKI